ncbi:hypothetical protein [Cerasicoccus fimbriatus]|uniref:hypothetical protein n=1 Tax=Cerasicoccus fimbriatus TaxID=3014554 RepID=UPI0022B2EB7C|nr:hypothetical protein [Cerasicoccus sp. TK19100]
MKLLVYSLFSLSTLSASAAFITYQNGVTNTINADGDPWVTGTSMYLNIVDDYGSSPLGPSGATGNTTDLDTFSPGGGGFDISLLTWEFGSLDLYTGPGSVTQSPGPASPGFEDYRISGAGPNLTFYYNGDEWVTGDLTRFITAVDNVNDFEATGTGEATITNFTVAGTAFFNEIMSLTGGTGVITFTADGFSAVQGPDPATFTSDGTISIVPEPGVTAAGIGAIVLGAVLIRRRK